MLREHFGHCKDAAAGPQSAGTGTGGKHVIEAVEAGGRERNCAMNF